MLVQVHVPVINLKVGVSFDHSAVSLCFIFYFGYKQRLAQETSQLELHLFKSHTEAIMHAPQIITYTVIKKGEWSTKENIGRTMM